MEEKKKKPCQEPVELTGEDMEKVTGGAFDDLPRVTDTPYSSDPEESDIRDRI